MIKTARQFAKRIPPSIWLIIIAFLAYLPSLNGDFFWDDDSLIVGNVQVNSPGGLVAIWTKPGTLAEYYPLTHTTYWLEKQTIGLQPMVLHSINVLLFGLTGIALWKLFERLKINGAWAGAALFLVHPIHVEAVAWMSQRKTVLSGLFYVLAALAYYKFKDGEGKKHYAWAVFLFGLALLSKTAVLGLPFVFLIINWWREKRWDKRWLVEAIPFVTLSIASALITLNMEFASTPTPDIAARTILDKLEMAGVVPFLYLFRFVWPFGLNLTYPDPPNTMYIGLALLFGIGSFLFAKRNVWTRAPFSIYLYVLVSLGPILGLVYFPYMGISYTADRFQYLADMGLVAALAAVLSRANQRQWIPAAGGLLGAAWFSFSLYVASIYRSPETLWQFIVSRQPTSWIALEAQAGFAKARSQEEALQLYRQAWASSIRATYSGNEIALDMIQRGQIEDGRQLLKEIVTKVPGDAISYYNLAITYIDGNDLKTALDWLEKGHKVDPTYVPITLNLAETLGIIQDPNLRDINRAVKLAESLNDDLLAQTGSTLLCLGNAYRVAGRKQDALRVYEQAANQAAKESDFNTEAAIRQRIRELAGQP